MRVIAEGDADPAKCEQCTACGRRIWRDWIPGVPDVAVFTGFWIADPTKGPDVDVPEWDSCDRGDCPHTKETRP